MKKYYWKIYDWDIQKQLSGAVPNFKIEKKVEKKESFIDKITNFLFPAVPDKVSKKSKSNKNKQDNMKTNLSLEEQIRKFLEMSDDEYQDSKLTSDLRAYLQKLDQEFERANENIKQKIAPSSFDIWVNEVNVSGMYARTYYINSYPSIIDFLWTRWLVNLDWKYDTSWFIYPTEKWDMN